ncbi:hypothetical protein D3C80_2035410 [compost metagenome]
MPTWTARSGYCARQSRAFFAQQGWDWLDFVRNGISAQRLIETGDALALHLVEHAETVEASHGQ